MYVIREVLNCKPGKVRPMVEKLKVLSAAAHEAGSAPFRLLTDVSGEPYWTVIAEVDVEAIEDFFAMENKLMTNPAVGKAMSDYHELVVSGRREIYRLES